MKMSATQDRSQKVSFYFGNAARDLDHLLPREEIVEMSASGTAGVDHLSRSLKLDEISSMIDRLSGQLETLEKNRREVSFLIADLRRMIS